MQATPVPRKAVINHGLYTVILIAWKAAMPCGGGSRPRAIITKLEKAKKTPATSPQPSAAKNVKLRLLTGRSTKILVTMFFLESSVHNEASEKRR